MNESKKKKKPGLKFLPKSKSVGRISDLVRDPLVQEQLRIIGEYRNRDLFLEQFRKFAANPRKYFKNTMLGCGRLRPKQKRKGVK